MDSQPPDDDRNPYAAPRSSLKPEPVAYDLIGDVPILAEPNPNARVRYDMINEAWTLLKQKLGTWILMTLIAESLAFVVYIVLIGGFEIVSEAPGAQPPLGETTIGGLIFFTLVLIVGIVVAFLFSGMLRAAIRQVRGLPIGVADLFRGGDVLLPVIGTWFLVTLASTGGLILCFIPGLYIFARFLLAMSLVVDGRLSPTKAMGLSWRALRGQVFKAFVFWFTIRLIATLGIYACCVGSFFTVPIAVLSYAVLYRDFFLPHADPTDSPWINTKPDLAPDF